MGKTQILSCLFGNNNTVNKWTLCDKTKYSVKKNRAKGKDFTQSLFTKRKVTRLLFPVWIVDRWASIIDQRRIAGCNYPASNYMVLGGDRPNADAAESNDVCGRGPCLKLNGPHRLMTSTPRAQGGDVSVEADATYTVNKAL